MAHHKGPRKVFTDEMLQLDVRKLHKARRLDKPGGRLHVTWNSDVWRYGVHMESSIGVEFVDMNELALRYEIPHPDGRRESVHQKVTLTWQALHLGGRRPWFSCPVCGRRTAILYAGRGASRFACRKCYNLAYRVENESISDRWGRRHQRLWKLLGRDLAAEDDRWRVIRRLGLENESPAFLKEMGLKEEDLWPVWGKPRHMHWRTYDRVMARIHDAGDNLPRLRFEPPPDTSRKNRPRSEPYQHRVRDTWYGKEFQKGKVGS